MARALPMLLLAAALGLPAGAAAAEPLAVRDGRIVDRSTGATVVLRGVNVVYKPAPYLPHGSSERTSFDRRDVRRLRSWGFNAIRLGVTWKALMPTRGKVSNDYLARVVKLVRLAERGGLYVLVDMHQDLWSERFQGNGAPAWATITDGLSFTKSDNPFPLNYLQPAVGRAFTNFFENRHGIRTLYVRAYSSLARRLRDDNGVLGFDLFNEPICEVAKAPCALPPPPEAAGKWLQPFYDELVPALEKSAPKRISFYEDGVTVNTGLPFLIGYPPNKPWPFRGEGLSFHVYCTPLIRPGVPCATQESEAIANAAAAASHNGVASLSTEFGATDDIATLRRVTGLYDQAGDGWLYWQYKTYGDPTTAASGDKGGADAESIVSAKGHVKRTKLRVLARTYPERIAGRDAKWSFDDRSGRFSLTYRPLRGEGDTVISLPLGLHYPRGHRVRVRNATIESRRGASRVVIRAVRGAQTVTVTVSAT
ncbi:MAG: cellulase family glycosylhydrolase [Thermoleophilaceae bacterium]